MQTQLRLPGQRLDVLRHGWAAFIHPLSHLRRGAVVPGGLTEHCACKGAARLGDATWPARTAAAVFAGCQAEVGGELADGQSGRSHLPRR